MSTESKSGSPTTAKIYTKSGDQGRTRLVDGRECSKASLRVESYGSVDELNSTLGLVLHSLRESRNSTLSNLGNQIESIQNQLFTVGSHLACEKEETRKMLPAFEERWVQALEHAIDGMTSQLPELKDFILPGGSQSASLLHISRTVCRRAERGVVALIENGHHEDENHRALRYLNRLSDHLFVAARYANQAVQVPDQIWKK
ncbi:MAG: cob(I)yrinic acid a,c-diamide adenosyltransferase [Pseudobdellovibrionaceae bacterium]